MLKGLYPNPHWQIANSTSIQQYQENSNPINKIGNKITLAHAAPQPSTGNKIGVSCNCKKRRRTRRCRCYKNDLKCPIYCQNTDYDCDNLKPFIEHTEATRVTGDIRLFGGFLHREVRVKKTWCSMNEKDTNYIHAKCYPVAAPQNVAQQGWQKKSECWWDSSIGDCSCATSTIPDSQSEESTDW